MLSTENQLLLRELAYKSIRHGLETGKAIEIKISEYPAELQVKKATFVTLHRNKELRGCIGILEPVRPLAADIAYNAWAAAFTDSRFMPVNAGELDDLDIHISILGTPEEMDFTSEHDLVKQIRPGIDGLILEKGFNKGTFLPSVWDSLTDSQEFLNHLKLKAGLTPNYWSDDIKMKRYAVEEF
ncbi:MAG: AmmeMemoRadiSam system protein A [Gammaproteobacteria bacterium]|nr:AmmeMemoRadiSam system protein A [Gammaproteobacteria bacterium]